MTEPPRCAIFDLDGTLADTAPDLVGAANVLLAGEGLPAMPVGAARSTAGFGAKALIRKGHELAGIDVDETTVERLYQPFLDVYAGRVAQESALFDGVLDTLEALAADGWALGVCTNKPEALAVALLEELGVHGHFAALIGADTLPVRKPDPLPLREAIRLCGGEVARSVMIGDTETDFLTAQAAATPCVLTSFGYSPIDVGGFGAHHVIDRFDDLLQVLAGIHDG